MKIHEACMAFARRQDRSNFPIDAKWRDLDIWPEATTAAVICVGALDDAKDDGDLDVALENFKSLYGDDDDDAPITYTTWRATLNDVMEAMSRLATDVAERARLAVRQRRAARFSVN
jgi:hypothetical protein